MPTNKQRHNGKGTPRCMGGEGRGLGLGRRGQGRGMERQGQSMGRQGQRTGQTGDQGRGMGGRNRNMSGQGPETNQDGGQGRGMGGRASQAEQSPMGVAPTTNVSKVAVSSEGPTLSDRVDPRFGRAGGFAVVDMKTMDVEYVDNGASQSMAQGAGIQAAETVANTGAQVLLSGYVGPKAHAALKAAGIAVGQDVDGMTVGEAVEQFRNGAVTMADAPNTQGGGPA